MQTNTANTQNDTASNGPPLSTRGVRNPRFLPLGTDTENREHVYSKATRTVYAIDRDTGERVHVEALPERADIEDWMEHVESVCGWERRQYGIGLVELLAQANGWDQ